MYDGSVLGQPVDINQLFNYEGELVVPVFGRNLFQQRLPEVLSIWHLLAIRRLSMVSYNQNPNLHGLITGIRSYTLGGGYTVTITPKEKKNKDAVAQIQNHIDDFCTNINFDERCMEAFIRAHVEGDCFLRLFPQANGITDVRFIEPDQVLPPNDQNWDGIPELAPWSYGILSRGNDTEIALGYSLLLPDNANEKVKPQFIHHRKVNVNMNVKRGLPSTNPIFTELDNAKKLRYASALSEAVRQSIAYFRAYKQADQSSIQALQRGLQTGEVWRHDGPNGTPRQVTLQKVEPGTVQDISNDQTPVDPPHSSSDTLLIVHDLMCQACSARFNAPEWLASGKSNTSSYSASITAESPFFKRLQTEQKQDTNYWRVLFQKVVDIGIEQEIIPANANTDFNVVVNAPSPLVRNQKEQNDVYQMLWSDGLMSSKTRCAMNGLDLDEELEFIAEEEGRIEPQGIQVQELNMAQEAQTMSGKMQQEQGKKE